MTAPLVVTLGDPAGIGPEVVAGAAKRTDAPFFVLGCAETLRVRGADIARIAHPGEAPFVPSGRIAVLDRPLPAPPLPGTPVPAHARHVIDWIEEAVALCLSGAASGLVTAPINKKVLKEGGGFAFPGHTEFLAHLTGAERAVMMLAGPDLRVVPVTIHIALADVPGALTAGAIVETATITHDALIRDFGIARPRIAVAGLNPHAGEGGVMGREEIEILAPALDVLRRRGIDLRGPLPADTMFHARARRAYDAAICMYHDQALVPLKTLAFDEGVNVTLGLPIIRTSPDHGTAYDIAGTGRADPASMAEALALAARMAEARA